MTGPLALVGSGEYLPSMLDVERRLLEHAVAAGRPATYVQIPTAASLEGPTRLDWWIRLGVAQAERLGVEAVPVPVTDRAEADDQALAAQVADAGLIYLSGGNPSHLADTLRGTAVWRAVLEAWQGGAALAGCSAGAMVMGAWIPELRHPIKGGTEGLGVTPALRVLPHFDRWMGRLPDAVIRPLSRSDEGVVLVGVDEETAVVHGLGTDDAQWQVLGHRSAWVLRTDGKDELASGTRAELPTPVVPRA